MRPLLYARPRPVRAAFFLLFMLCPLWAVAPVLPAQAQQQGALRLEGGGVEELDGAFFLPEAQNSTLRVTLSALEPNRRVQVAVHVIQGRAQLECIAPLEDECVTAAHRREASYTQDRAVALALRVMPLADALQLEDTELVELLAIGRDLASGEEILREVLPFSVPRQGYRVAAVRILTPAPIYEFIPLRLEAELNAPASSEATVALLFLTEAVGVSPVAVSIPIPPGAFRGTVEVDLVDALVNARPSSDPTFYVFYVSLLSGFATGGGSLSAPPVQVSSPFPPPGDQALLQFTVYNQEVGLRWHQGALEFTAGEPPVLSAGEEARLTVDLIRPEQYLDVQIFQFITVDDREALGHGLAVPSPFSGSRGIRFRTPFRALADERPLPRRAAGIQLRIVAEPDPAQALEPLVIRRISLTLPRANYRVESLQVPATVPADVPVEVGLVLNAPAPVPVNAVLRATIDGPGDRSVAGNVHIPAGQSEGFTRMSLPESSAHRQWVWDVQQALFAPPSVLDGDQLNLLEAAPPPAVHSQVLSREQTLADLHLEARLTGDTGQVVSTLVEGETAVLQLSVSPLLENQVLQLRIDETSGELLLGGAPSTNVQFTHSVRMATVLVQARDDDVPEPQETVTLRLSTRDPELGPGPAHTLQLDIPYNDYRVEELELQERELRVARPVQLTAGLNAPAPAPVDSKLDILRAEVLVREYEFRFPAGRSSTSLFVTLPMPGDYTFRVSGARFSDLPGAAAGAQLRLPVTAPAVEAELHDSVQFRALRLVDAAAGILKQSQDSFVLAERTAGGQLERTNSAALEVELENRFPGQQVQLTVLLEDGSGAALGTGEAGSVGLQRLDYLMSSERAVVGRVIALEDALSPEPAQEVTLSVSGLIPGTGERIATATLNFYIPHHGYRLPAPEPVPPRASSNLVHIPAGVSFGVEAFLAANLDAPADLEVIFHLGSCQGAGLFPHVIPAGGNRVLFLRQYSSYNEAGAICQAGVHSARFLDGLGEAVAVDSRLFDFALSNVYGGPGEPDESQRGYAATVELVPLEPGVLQEGSTALLTFTFRELRGIARDTVLLVNASIPSAVRFSPVGDILGCSRGSCAGELSLPAGSTYRGSVQVYLLDDDIAQPRREVQLSVNLTDAARSDVLGRTGTSLVIPRNDYAVTGLQLSASRVGPGQDLSLGVELNHAASGAPVVVLVQERVANGDERMHSIQVPQNMAFGEISYSLDRAGKHQYRVLRGYFLETAGGTGLGDQLELSVAASSSTLVVQPPVQLTAVLQDGTGQLLTELVEGQTATVLVSAQHLETSQSVVAYLLNPARGEDIRLPSADLLLTSDRPRATVELQVVEDHVPEPREEIVLRLHWAGGGESVELYFAIAREDYRVTHLEAPQRVRADAGVELEITLNAPVERGELLVQLLGVTADGALLSDRLWRIPVVNEEVVAENVPLSMMGRYEIRVMGAYFDSLLSAGADEREMRIDAQPVRLEADAPLQFMLRLEDSAGRELTQLQEGERALLRTKILNRLPGEVLQLTAEIAAGDEDAVLECTAGAFALLQCLAGSARTVSWVQAGASTTAVAVLALPDIEGVEDREEVLLHIGGFVPGTGQRASTATLGFTVRRHGYRVDALRVSAPPPVYVGAPVELSVVLNAPAPATAQFTIAVFGPDMIPPRTVLASAGQRTGTAVVRLPQPGTYTALVLDAEFRTAPGELLLPLLQTEFQVREAQFEVDVLLHPPVLNEGGRSTLTVFVSNLSGTDAELLLVPGASETPVDFSQTRLPITVPGFAQRVPATVTLSVRDDRRPQARRDIRLGVNLWDVNDADGAVVGGGEAIVQVPRHGWVMSMQAPAEVTTGVWPPVTLHLNGNAPVAVEAVVELTAIGASEAAASIEILMPAGVRMQRALLPPLPVGRYTLAVRQARFVTGVEGEDQPSPDLPVPQSLRWVSPPPLLSLYPRVREIAAESGAVQWTLGAGNLDTYLAGNQTLTVSIDALQVDGDVYPDLRLSASTLVLSRATPTATVRGLLPLGRGPEPGEEIVLRARAPGASAATARLFIARRGYELRVLHAPSVVGVDNVFMVGVELNAPAPTVVQVVLGARSLQGREQRTRALQIARNATTGWVGFQLGHAGEYEFFVSGASFVEAGSAGADQRSIPARLVRPVVQVIPALRFLAHDAAPEAHEGDRSVWTLQADSLVFFPGYETFEVEIGIAESDGDTVADAVLLSPSRATLSQSTPSLRVEVLMQRDEIPEPREQVLVTASVVGLPDTSTATRAFIPRHGYALTGLRAPPRAHVGRPLQVELQLNGEVAVAVHATVRATMGAATREAGTAIEPGRSTALLTFRDLGQAGDWTLAVVEAMFRSTRPLDQEAVELLATTARVSVSEALQPYLLVEEALLTEGNETLLTVGATNLLAGMTLQLRLETRSPAHARDVGFVRGMEVLMITTVSLTSALPSTQLRVRALEDDLPEIREHIVLRASVPGFGETGTTTLTIPRHGYVIESWELYTTEPDGTELPPDHLASKRVWWSAQRVHAGDEVYFLARLNAVAPLRLDVVVKRIAGGFVGPQGVLEILPGQRVGWMRLHLGGRAFYRLNAALALFSDYDERYQEYWDEDQFWLSEGRGRELWFEVFSAQPGLELLMGVYWPREVMEGSTVRFTARGDSLRLGTTMTVQVDVPDSGDVRTVWGGSTTVHLTVDASRHVLALHVLEDGVPERREEIVIHGRGFVGERVVEAQTMFTVPRHGYEVQGFRVAAPEILLGEELKLLVELNAPVPSTVSLRAQLRPVSGAGAVEDMEWEIGPGRSTGTVSLRPQDAGSHVVELKGAVFLQWTGRDQQRLPGVGAEATFQVWRAGIGEESVLNLQLSREYMPEGTTASLSVRLGSILGEEEVRVRLMQVVGTTGTVDVKFFPDQVVLRPGRRSQGVKMRLLQDGMPEPRETVVLRGVAQVRGIELRGETSFVTARHGYGAQFRAEREELRAGESVVLQWELNGPSPALLRVTLRVHAPGMPTWWEVIPLSRGSRLVQYEFVAGTVGEYRVHVQSTYFDSAVDIPYLPFTSGGVDQFVVNTNPRMLSVQVREGAPGSSPGTMSSTSSRAPNDAAKQSGHGFARHGGGTGMDDARGGREDGPRKDFAWQVSSGMVVLREGEEFQLELRVSRPLEGKESVSVEVAELPVQYAGDLELGSMMLGLSAASGENTALRVAAVRDGRAEPVERVDLLLQGETVSATGSREWEEVLEVWIPRNEYAVSTMTVRASAAHPADEFVVEVELNREVPADSTVEVTVSAFAGQTDELRGRVRLSVMPGAASGSRHLILPRVGVYTLAVTSASFMLSSEWRGQEELELAAMGEPVSVHALLDYEAVSVDGWFRDLQLLWLQTRFFDQRPGVPGGVELCTEEARTSSTLAGRLPCLDVSGDGLVDRTDMFLLWGYMNLYAQLLAGEVEKSLIADFTPLVDSPEEMLDEVILRIQGLYPRTRRVCREFALDCD